MWPTDSAVCPHHPAQTEERYNTAGQQLLALVRSIEKKHEPTDDLLEAEFKKLVRLLQFLIQFVARNGILRGDNAAAERRVEESSSFKVERFDGKNDKRRGKTRSRVLNLGNGDGEGVTRASSSCADQIVSSITRILGGDHQSPNCLSQCLVGLTLDDQRLLILLVSDLLTSITTFVRQGLSKASACVAAEYDLLASNAKSLLTGLTKSMEYILATASGLMISKSGGKEHNPIPFPIDKIDTLALLALQASHRAAASLTSLLGPRLSRLSTHLQNLCTVGVWESFSVVDHEVVESATQLYAAIQVTKSGTASLGQEHLTAGAEDPWNTSLRESVALLFSLFLSVVPINSRLEERAQQQEILVQQGIGKAALDVWLQSIRNTDSEEQRTVLFLHCVHILVSMVTALLLMETMGWNHLLSVKVDIISMMDLVEVLICFPITSESVYFGTKKRLRGETMEIAQFSPAAIAGMANRVKVWGHDLLDVLVSSLGFPVLLPFARRLLKTCYGSLLTSSSTALRNVLENNVSKSASDRIQKRWLNSSVFVRTAALKSVKRALLVMGVEPFQRSTHMGILKTECDVDRLVALVCGCLVEQLQWLTRPQEKTDDWGSFEERIDSLVAAGNCLNACLVSGGPFLSNSARSLIDSTAEGFMNKCATMESDRVRDLSPVFNCALNLGIQSCSTPCPDGESCSLRLCLRETARRLQTTSHESVMLTVLSSLRICDTIATPRVPALQVITHKFPTKSTSSITTNVHILETQLEEETKLGLRAETSKSEERESKIRKIAHQEGGVSNRKVPQQAVPDLTQKDSFEKIKTVDAAEDSVQYRPGKSKERMDESNSVENGERLVVENDISTLRAVAQISLFAERSTATTPRTDSIDGGPMLVGVNSAVDARSPCEDDKEDENDIPMIFDAPPDEEDE